MSCHGDLIINIVRGDTKRILFELSDDDDEPINLTGSALQFIASWAGGSLTKSTDDSDDFTIDDPSTGEAALVLTSAETGSFPLVPITYKVVHVSADAVTTLVSDAISVVG